MAKNIRNNGTVIGRPTKAPVVFTNKDGSRKVMLSVAVQDNYTGKDGKKNTQFVNLEGFVRADKQGNGVYDVIHEGDLIGVEFSVRSNNYEKNGEMVYSQVLFIEGIDLLEGKAVTDARQARKAEAAAAEAPAPAPEEAPFK